MTVAQLHRSLIEENAQLKAQTAQMAERLSVLEQQVAWFKRQLFGRKSEKKIIDVPHQPLLDGWQDDASADEPPVTSTEVKGHKRRSRKQRSGQEVNDSGLRFDESVPQKIIELPAPELTGPDAEQFEIIDYKDTVRLAQQPGSYTVLIYRRPVVRHKRDHSVSEVAAPSNVLEGCVGDVSVIAGLMVDKAVYHLPLYRQHQRMLDSGIRVSRSTLLNWVNKGIELLRPIYQAQWRHILQSQVLAMDEVPIKAGRKSKGKMQQTYYWPLYGEEDEVAFVPMDTNHLERALRVIPMGRKNYLFCWTELGAEQLGLLQSLMVTCRLQGINPYTYLVDVLQRVGLHPASQVEDLTPRVWKTKFADNFLTSDLAL